MDRLVCDPFVIPMSVVNMIQDWSKHVSYTFDDYVDFMWWGALGQNRVAIPKNARWDHNFTSIPEDQSKEDITVLDPISKSVVDPFAAEIGTDFLQDLSSRAEGALSTNPKIAAQNKAYFLELFQQSNPDVLIIEIDDSKTLNSRFLNFLSELDVNLKITRSKVFEAAQKNDEHTGKLVLKDLLTQHLTLNTSMGKKIFLLGNPKENLIGGQSGQVWIRTSKWPGVNPNTMILNRANIQAAAIDRGLYKAGLLYGMKNNASRISHEILEFPPEICK